MKSFSKLLRDSKPIYIENSKVPVILSYIAPITIGAITLGPFIFSRGVMDEDTRQHEAIHWQQYIDCAIIGFPLLYLFYYIWGYIKYRDQLPAYLSIPFEQEAYVKEQEEDYLQNRKRWNWLQYKV